MVNPTAGRGRGRRVLGRVRAWLEQHPLPHRILVTERPGHARAWVASLPQDAVVIAVGGDGTVHEVTACCLGTNRTLGVVPAGSGDDFAHALGLPPGRPEATLARLAAGTVRLVDTGLANGTPFVNAVGSGFDAEVGALVRRAPWPLAGAGAYLWAVAAGLRQLRPVGVRVEVDGREVHAGQALLAACLNGPRAGGSFRFAPGADPADGVLEVVLAGAIGRAGTVRLVPRLMAGRHLDDPRVRLFRGRRIALVWQAPRAWHTDGEVAAPTARLDVEVRPGSLRVLAPA